MHLMITAPQICTGPFSTTTGNVSDVYVTEITPSGWTFSIWSVIYVWLTLMIIYILANLCRKYSSFNYFFFFYRKVILRAPYHRCSFFFVVVILCFSQECLRLCLLQSASLALWILHLLVFQSVLQYRLAACLGQSVSFLQCIVTVTYMTNNPSIHSSPKPLILNRGVAGGYSS